LERTSHILDKTRARELIPIGISQEDLATMKAIRHIGNGATPPKYRDTFSMKRIQHLNS
jgi:hypothetical protein